jgi:hypothetical protein
MGSPEVTGDKPQHHGLSEFTILPEKRGVGPLVKKPEKPEEQPPDPELEAFRQVQKEPKGLTVFENPLQISTPIPQKPSEERGEPDASKSNPAEQQAAERLGKPPPEGEVVETLDPEIEEAIRAYVMGDPEEEPQLREQAKKDPILRAFFKEGPTSLTSSSPDFSIIRKPEDLEDTSHS